jgi:NAD(P)-dependent dehydrogenase (short-subunit alcohol dehydrogenase family)
MRNRIGASEHEGAPVSDFEGKTAFVTGAASGIGRASALAFADRGANVVVADITEKADETVALIEARGGTALAVRVDVGDSDAVGAAIDGAVDRFGGLDFAHNNAGTFAAAPVAELDETDFARVIEVNLAGIFYCMKHELRHMLPAGRGAIVNTASIWSFVAASGQAAYVASKHGVAGLTKAAALDHGGAGIRVNAVAPGPIETAMTAAVPTEVMAGIVGRTVAERMGQPTEIAQAVTWLCSDAASYVNGVVLPVDGGWLTN